VVYHCQCSKHVEQVEGIQYATLVLAVRKLPVLESFLSRKF